MTTAWEPKQSQNRDERHRHTGKDTGKEGSLSMRNCRPDLDELFVVYSCLVCRDVVFLLVLCCVVLCDVSLSIGLPLS